MFGPDAAGSASARAQGLSAHLESLLCVASKVQGGGGGRVLGGVGQSTNSSGFQRGQNSAKLEPSLGQAVKNA